MKRVLTAEQEQVIDALWFEYEYGSRSLADLVSDCVGMMPEEMMDLLFLGDEVERFMTDADVSIDTFEDEVVELVVLRFRRVLRDAGLEEKYVHDAARGMRSCFDAGGIPVAAVDDVEPLLERLRKAALRPVRRTSPRDGVEYIVTADEAPYPRNDE